MNAGTGSSITTTAATKWLENLTERPGPEPFASCLSPLRPEQARGDGLPVSSTAWLNLGLTGR